MIEPTETESKKELDRFAEAMIKISKEKPEIIKDAPNRTPVKRVNEVEATKNQVFTWNKI